MDIHEFVEDVARGAGAIVRDKRFTFTKFRSKDGGADLVTEVDEESEAYILGRIKEQFPEDSILSEESGASGEFEGKRVWIVDPIDGTRNFAIGIPFFCISIAAVRDGKPEVGALYDPIHDEFFFAQRGQGAFLNGEPIRVAQQETLSDAVVSVSWVKRKCNREQFLRYIDIISKETSYFRRFGSAALVMCYVACGRVHAYMQGGLNPWDVAAATLVIEEAGGRVTDFKGIDLDMRNERIEVLTSNPKLHSQLLTKVICGSK